MSSECKEQRYISAQVHSGVSDPIRLKIVGKGFFETRSLSGLVDDVLGGGVTAGAV